MVLVGCDSVSNGAVVNEFWIRDSEQRELGEEWGSGVRN